MGLLRLHSMLGLDKAATIQKTLSLELHKAVTLCKTLLLVAKIMYFSIQWSHILELAH